MIFSNLKLNDNEPIYIQLKNYISDMISKGLIPDNSKLPSTRELSQLLQVSRNSVVLTYEELKSEGLIYSISGKGTFVKSKNKSSNTTWICTRYKPLIDYLLEYMTNKGADISNKDILITNGFTEGFDIIMSSFTQEKDYIICENPTHNTAIKIMKSHNLNILGVDINEDGLDFNMLEDNLVKYKNKIKFAYITPSYHNPTGIVMTPENRYKFYNLMKKYNIAIIEDGFNEELLYNSSHIFPICSLDNMNNGVVYIGSFSKILFPGMRIGWIFADKKVINKLESVKRCRNIHVSFLDQGILFDYLSNGGFEKYIKKIRKFYGDKFNFAYKCIKKYIKTEYILGDGGLHIFIKLKNIDTRVLLEKCYEKNVIFMPGDLFFTDNSGFDTLRLGFSRLSFEDIEIGIKIIGETINEMF